MLTNPTLVVEVTSESTVAYDRGTKSKFYRSLPSLEAYLLLEAVNCTLPLSEIYQDIDFGDPESQ